MRHTLTISLIALSLLGALPRAHGQETRKDRIHKETADADADSEDDTVQVAGARHRPRQKGTELPVTVGIHGGLNDAALIFGGNASGDRYGVLFGTMMDVHVGGIVHFETGLMYAMTGGSNIVYRNSSTGVYGSGDYTWGINTLELPATFEFKFGKPGRNHFFIGLGGYVAYNLGGTLSPDGGTLHIGSNSSDDLKALDLGIGFDIGYQFRSGLFLRVRGQGGISDLRPQTETLYVSTIRTSSSTFEVGYFFGKPVQHPAKHRTQAWE